MLLQVKNLRCGYGSLEVVHGISLHVCPGEIVGLLGGNGAGKTTLLKALVGLLRPWRGEILVNGRPVHNQPAWRCVSNAVALVPEGRQIFADMTVRENLIGGYHNAYRRMDVRDGARTLSRGWPNASTESAARSPRRAADAGARTRPDGAPERCCCSMNIHGAGPMMAQRGLLES